MLHRRSIHQLKLLEALQKKRIKNSTPVEQYTPVESASESSEPIPVPQLEQEPYLEPEPVPIEQVQNTSVPIQVITPTDSIMDTTMSTPKKSFPYQKKSIPIEIEQYETRKLFEEYEQYKHEQYLWNKLHGK